MRRSSIGAVLLWIGLLSGSALAQSWSLTGNAGTTPGTNFLGTTDAKDLVCKTNNVERVRIMSTGPTAHTGDVRVSLGAGANPEDNVDLDAQIRLCQAARRIFSASHFSRVPVVVLPEHVSRTRPD